MNFARRLLPLLAALSPTSAAAEDPPQQVAEIVESLRSDCSAFEGGELTMEDGALRQVDLSGDGTLDWVLDTSHITCSTMHSMTCGTGGCSLYLSVGDTITKRLSKGWQTIEFGPIRAVLLQIHGANCGGTNLNYCLEAMVWDDSDRKFYSLASEAD